MTIAGGGGWRPLPGIVAATICFWLVACSSLPRPAVAGSPSVNAPGGSVYVIRRGWHVDIAVALTDLRPPLDQVAAGLPGTRFVLFGFGDRRYLLHGANMIAALWPGAGVLLVTGIPGNPSETFGQKNVASVALDPEQMSALQTFVRDSLDTPGGPVAPIAPGPYPGSAYFASSQPYSGLHTCNTWAAQSLRSAGLPVNSGGVVFAWQLWHQLRNYAHPSAAL